MIEIFFNIIYNAYVYIEYSIIYVISNYWLAAKKE